MNTGLSDHLLLLITRKGSAVYSMTLILTLVSMHSGYDGGSRVQVVVVRTQLQKHRHRIMSRYFSPQPRVQAYCCLAEASVCIDFS